MAILADISTSSDNPHPVSIIDQLDGLIPLDYHEPSPLGSSLIKLLCLDSWYGIQSNKCYISLDPVYLSWLPDFLAVLDPDYLRVMNIVNGAEVNGAMHDRQLEAELEGIGRRGFKVQIIRPPQFATRGVFSGLDLLVGKEYQVRSHRPAPDAEDYFTVPLAFTATLDGQPIDLRSRLIPVR